MIRVETARDLLDGMRPKQELVAFATALHGEQAEIDVLDFLEKPWKWADEYACWVNAGRPVEPGWSLVAELDCDMEAAKTAFLEQDIDGIGHSVKVRERIGGADRALAVREDALAERRLDS